MKIAPVPQDSEKLSLLEELRKEIHAKDWELERLTKAQAAKDEDAAKLRVKSANGRASKGPHRFLKGIRHVWPTVLRAAH